MKRRKNRLIDIRTRLAVTVLNIASRSDFKPDFRSLSSTKKTKSPIRLCQIIHLQANRYALSIFSFGKLVKKQLRHTTSFMSIRRQFWHFNIGSKNANGKKYDSAYVSQSRNPNTNFDFENDVKWTFSTLLALSQGSLWISSSYRRSQKYLVLFTKAIVLESERIYPREG